MQDHLGSTNFLLDEAGQVVSKRAEIPFGMTWKEENGEAFAYSYTGKEKDREINLTYFGARFYIQDIGRWLSPDPLFAESAQEAVKKGSLGELNLYSYIGNNPVMGVDPMGLEDYHFLVSFKNNEIDNSNMSPEEKEKEKELRSQEMISIYKRSDELRKKGYSVKIIENANVEDMHNSFHDPEARGIYISAHSGGPGAVSAENGIFDSTDIDPAKRSGKLEVVALVVCYQGKQNAKTYWDKALGKNGILQYAEEFDAYTEHAIIYLETKFKEYVEKQPQVPKTVIPNPKVYQYEEQKTVDPKLMMQDILGRHR